MRVRLGIGTYTFTWAVGVAGRSPAGPLSARDLVERAAAVGVDCVQIADKEVARTLAPHALNLHVKDFRVRRPSHTMGFVLP